MPTSSRLNVDIHVGAISLQGEYANAFRVVGDADGCVLEFLVYSPKAHRAVVVRRVRVDQEFLPVIRDNVRQALQGSAHVKPPPIQVPLHPLGKVKRTGGST